MQGLKLTLWRMASLLLQRRFLKGYPILVNCFVTFVENQLIADLKDRNKLRM